MTRQRRFIFEIYENKAPQMYDVMDKNCSYWNVKIQRKMSLLVFSFP